MLYSSNFAYKFTLIFILCLVFSSAQAVEIGEKSPAFSAKYLSGDQGFYSLSQARKSQIQVINFFYRESQSDQATYVQPTITPNESEAVVTLPTIKRQQSASKLATLLIESQPDGAEVLLDDESVGQTSIDDPLLIPNLKANTQVTVQLNKNLYAPARFSLTLSGGLNEVEPIKLKPLFGTLKITSTPPGASFNMRGKSYQTPVTIKQVKSGKYRLNMSKKKYFSQPVSIQIKNGETTSKHIQLKANFGTLIIASKPTGANVEIKNQQGKIIDSGTTPYRGELQAGKYTLKLSQSGYDSLIGDATVVRGQTVRREGSKKITLRQQQGFITVLTKPFSRDAKVKINGTTQGKVGEPIRLPAGQYTLNVQSKKGRGSQKITIRDRQDKSITITLQKGGVQEKGGMQANALNPPISKNQFIKISNNGKQLSRNANRWSCVYDKSTNRYWEVKTNDNSPQDKDNKYRWGGKTALPMANDGERYQDWDKLVDYVNNKALCGWSDWRVPTLPELRSIVDYAKAKPAMDTNFFPNTQQSWYWSSSPYVNYSYDAWLLGFKYGNDYDANRSDYSYARLVRVGQ